MIKLCQLKRAAKEKGLQVRAETYSVLEAVTKETVDRAITRAIKDKSKVLKPEHFKEEVES